MKILTAAMVLGLAGTAIAKDPSSATLMSSASGLNAQVINPQASGASGFRLTATYDFATGSMTYGAGALANSIIFDPPTGGLRLLGVEFSDIAAEVNHNVGSSFENWASELRLGWDDANFGIIGIAPFPGVDDGPLGGQGSSQLFTGGSLPYFDLDGTIDIDSSGTPDDFFMPAGGSATGAFSVWNDGTGQPAGTIVGGTITFYLVPAPGAAALFAMGGLAAIRRRR